MNECDVYFSKGDSDKYMDIEIAVARGSISSTTQDNIMRLEVLNQLDH